MKVLSLFDGMSCGQIALNKLNIKIEEYYASEIDVSAIKVTQKNYPKTIQVGDVSKLDSLMLPDIDLLIGGSPCQGFSFAGKQLNFDDPRSVLFFEYVRLLKDLKPRYFFLENVLMKKEYQDIISEHLGVEPIEINSAVLSAQSRKRLYWTNIPFKNIEEREVNFKDILVDDFEDKYYSKKVMDRLDVQDIQRAGKAGYKFKGREVKKCPTLLARHYKGMQTLAYPIIREKDKFRRLTPIECERLQTVPDDYTACVADTNRYKMLGNGWTVDIIMEFFKGLKD